MIDMFDGCEFVGEVIGNDFVFLQVVKRKEKDEVEGGQNFMSGRERLYARG